MARLELPLVANVTEAGDIVLVAFALVLTVLIGLALLGIDTLVGRLRRGGHPDGSARTRAESRPRSDGPGPARQ